MIVTVGNTKGGVGKTTLAVQVALARQIAGYAILLIDGDTQASAQNAMTMRSEGGQEPSVSCVQLPDGRLLRAQLGPLVARHTDTVIDAGGRDTQAFRVALVKSDVLVLPVQPRAVDVWALATMAELLEEAQEARDIEGSPALRILIAVNLADPGDNRDTAETLQALSQFPQLAAPSVVIRRRKAVANAMAHGLAVAELFPRDPKASQEIELLVSNLFGSEESANGYHAAKAARQVG